jgi:outer membrane lipoprotein LolB
MSRNYFLFSLLGILILMLSSCATVTQSPSAANQEKTLTWSQRETQLSAIKNWTLSGALGIRQQGQSQFVSLTWLQQGGNYQQTISGPLGMGAVRIIGSPTHVTFWKSPQQQYVATTPEVLMQEQLGWQLPVSDLYYWIRGLPVPGIADNKKLDAENHLVALQQQGWQINYLAYSDVNGIDLPTQIKLNNPMMNVKIVIRQWETS